MDIILKLTLFIYMLNHIIFFSLYLFLFSLIFLSIFHIVLLSKIMLPYVIITIQDKDQHLLFIVF